MPKFVLLSHSMLLVVLSLLVFPNVADTLGGTADLPRDLALRVAWVAFALGLVLVVTEVFSGVRWAAVVAFVAATTGLVTLLGRADVPTVSFYAWGIGWVAVVGWFASLAYRARSNR
ncbi:hypothetical protein PDG61_23645 [Mycolicibacterium sp. BiH015]|uniref:hypothetical protein n=1 Tax=Mycolicibacterium sp. BiH015 TaxID=3018808 RepID=UPI0022E2A710|nr:hypothetical protein [Mycolicibacterium sp. BiH015]MDA2893923.1 hypothetical protein [Mycolicibacterium sp. BiH015]